MKENSFSNSKRAAESFASRVLRWRVNCFPCYWMSGGRLIYVSPDFKEIWICLRLSWRTKNYAGTLFGGSLYASVDPIYMLMLAKLLGPDYVVWDKAATIRFRRPGTDALFARFVLNDAELDFVRDEVAHHGTVDRNYFVELVDKHGQVHATIDKVLYIAQRDAHEARLHAHTSESIPPRSAAK